MILPRYHGAVAASADGQMVLAIAHRGADGQPQLDEVRVLTVTGGEAGIAAVYRGLRDRGITIVPCRPLAKGARPASGRSTCDDARQRAILRVFASVDDDDPVPDK
jgi:hypothetical protein